MKANKELWEKMLQGLETEISAVNFDVWIKTLEPVNIIDSKFILLASNETLRNFVESKFKETMVKVMKKVNALMTDIIIISPSELSIYENEPESSGSISEDDDEPAPQKIEANLINPKYNFENFVVGGSNKFMYAAASAVADEPGVRYNPLFIYGGAGLGKTHIMHAIGNAVKVSHPTLKVMYVSSEKFLNELVESIRTTKDKRTNFRDKYRNVDVLMIDDIQFISGRAGTQEELFHTFNDLYQYNKQLVFSSDRPPKEIPGLEERLRSRFEWGLIADVQPPDLETRIAILQKKAQIAKHNIAGDVLTFMAEKMDRNIRDMESLLNKVIFLSRLYEVEPSIDIAKEALKDYIDSTEESISADAIMDCTAKYFNIGKDDLTGKNKKREIVEPRQICIYIITEMLNVPLATIGGYFGGRDHTTIMHARDKVAKEINSNIKIKVAVNDIKEMVLHK